MIEKWKVRKSQETIQIWKRERKFFSTKRTWKFFSHSYGFFTAVWKTMQNIPKNLMVKNAYKNIRGLILKFSFIQCTIIICKTVYFKQSSQNIKKNTCVWRKIWKKKYFWILYFLLEVTRIEFHLMLLQNKHFFSTCKK